MRRYETIFITYAELPEEEINGLIDRYATVIKGGTGTIVKVEKWGKRKLAYEVKKQSRGYYVLIDFAATAAVVTELERNLGIGDKILKYMTIKTQESVNMQDIEKEIAAGVVVVKVEQAAPSAEEKPATPENTEEAEAAMTVDKEGEAPLPAPASEEEK